MLNGYVEAEKVIKLLAEAWDENTMNLGYLKVAHEVARLSGILDKYRKEWDAWDGNMADPDVNTDVLYARRQFITRKEETNLILAEGQLILESALGKRHRPFWK